MAPAPNLDQRVRDGELTAEQAEEIAGRFWDKERDIDADRKTEKEEKQNES